MKESCALDIAERGGSTFEVIAEVLGLTREGARKAVTYAEWAFGEAMNNVDEPQEIVLHNDRFGRPLHVKGLVKDYETIQD